MKPSCCREQRSAGCCLPVPQCGEKPSCCKRDEKDWDDMTCREKFAKMLPVIIFKLLIPVGLYFADVGSDVKLAKSYYGSGDLKWCALTVGFVSVSTFTTMAYSLYLWYQQDNFYVKYYLYRRSDRLMWTVRIICTLLGLAPVLWCVESVCWAYLEMSDDGIDRIDKKQDNRAAEHQAARARLVEAFMESAPQLILQLCILMVQEDADFQLMQKITIGTSLASISWGMTCYYCAGVSSQIIRPHEIGVLSLDRAVLFVTYAVQIGARVVALAAFAVAYTWWVSVIAGGHWLCMFIWYIRCDMPLLWSKGDIATCFVSASTSIISCTMGKCGNRRYHLLWYHTLIFLENCLMIGIFWYASKSEAVYKFVAIGIVLGGGVCGILLQVLYYTACHPSKDHIRQHSFRMNTLGEIGNVFKGKSE